MNYETNLGYRPYINFVKSFRYRFQHHVFYIKTSSRFINMDHMLLLLCPLIMKRPSIVAKSLLGNQRSRALDETIVLIENYMEEHPRYRNASISINTQTPGRK